MPAGFQATTFASNLSNPTAMIFAPDGRLFINEKSGTIKIVKNGQLLPTPFLQIPVNTTANERGLLGIALDPDFATNRFIYLYYTRTQSPVKNRLSRFTVSSTNPDTVDPASEQILIDDIASDAGNHNGGAIHFGLDGKLYVGIGDGGQNHQNSQSLNTVSGKLLRVNTDGTAPADNPFVGTAGARGEIWAYGLRHPYTFAIHPTSGKIFVNDVGENTWEEINDIQKGANYGWPTCEGNCSNSNFINPVHTYNHSQEGGGAIVGGTFYTGNQFPSEYQGVYFFGDFVTNIIYTLDPNRGNAVTKFATQISGPVDMDVDTDGALYILSNRSGTVTKITSTMSPPTSSPTQIASPTTVVPTNFCLGSCPTTPTVTPTVMNTPIPTMQPQPTTAEASPTAPQITPSPAPTAGAQQPVNNQNLIQILLGIIAIILEFFRQILNR